MSSRANLKIKPIEIRNWDLKGDPRSAKEALGFEPVAMIVVDHRGETLGIPVQTLLPFVPEFAEEMAGSDPGRLASLLVTSLDYMCGFRKYEDKQVKRRVREYTPVVISSLVHLTKSPFTYIHMSRIDLATGNAKLKLIVTKAKSADEMREAFKREMDAA